MRWDIARCSCFLSMTIYGLAFGASTLVSDTEGIDDVRTRISGNGQYMGKCTTAGARHVSCFVWDMGLKLAQIHTDSPAMSLQGLHSSRK